MTCVRSVTLLIPFALLGVALHTQNQQASYRQITPSVEGVSYFGKASP